jgi:DNA-binding transcriptional regulator GbsR (MarR family)
MADLSQDLEKILEQAEIIKELRLDVKEMREAHPNFKKIEELNKEVKKLRDELNSDEEIERMKDEIANASDRLKLLKEILVARMQESEETKVTARGREAIVIPNMKIQKQQS